MYVQKADEENVYEDISVSEKERGKQKQKK